VSGKGMTSEHQRSTAGKRASGAEEQRGGASSASHDEDGGDYGGTRWHLRSKPRLRALALD